MRTAPPSAYLIVTLIAHTRIVQSKPHANLSSFSWGSAALGEKQRTNYIDEFWTQISLSYFFPVKFLLVRSLFSNPLSAPYAIATHLEHHVADKCVLGATNHILCFQLCQGNRLWGRPEEWAQSSELWDGSQLLWNRGCRNNCFAQPQKSVNFFQSLQLKSWKLLQQVVIHWAATAFARNF